MATAPRADIATRFGEGNTASLTHGAHSEPTVKRVATVQKRRLLRQIGLRAADLDGLGLGYLDAWARAQSKVELLDQWFSTHGFLGADGEPTPGVKVYFVACNSARLSLARLEHHLATRRTSPTTVLSRYIDEHYGDEDLDADES